MFPLNVTVTAVIVVKARLADSVIRMVSVDKEPHSVGTPVEIIQTCAVAWTEYA